ncbi:DEKNAAC102076 [Brettanomyces naardenensis]|uniref:DEKNAAC102076 n=1 Tax=Brettanomyces naardenensis TaxID=13370 RepID=A0A448YJP3_BRENA|nr:DEKNAAC102076 [Brettanomyces naardenensis]
MAHPDNMEDSPPGISLSLRYLRQKWSGNKLKVESAKSESIPVPVGTSDSNGKENTNPGGEPRRSFFSLRPTSNKLKVAATREVAAAAKEEEVQSVPSIDVIEEEQKTEDSVTSASDTRFLSPIKQIVSWYVGDLDKSVTEDLLRSHFGKYPGLVSVKVPRDITTGESLRYGYVNYDTEEHANNAREELNYSVLCGSEIRIMPSLRDKSLREKLGVNVFLSNLPQNLSSGILYNRFKKYGRILSCKYIPAKQQCFILFENKSEAHELIERVNNVELDGHIVYAGIHILKKDRIKEVVGAAIVHESAPPVPVNKAKPPPPVSSHRPVQPSTEFSIFMKNLPLDIEDCVIRNLVESYGHVQSVLSRQVPNRGGTWALVTLMDQESVNRAIQGLNSFEIEGRLLFVTRAIPREQKEYAKREERYPKKKLKILVSGLNIASNRERFEALCSSYRSIKSVEVYATTRRTEESLNTDYGYVEIGDEEEANSLIDSLKAFGCLCYKVSIGVPNKESNYDSPHYHYLLPSTEGVTGSPVSVSYIDPTKMYKLAKFNEKVENDKRIVSRPSDNRKRQYLENRRKADEVIWELAVRLFSEPLLDYSGGKASRSQTVLTAVKIHSLTEHIIKFFWVNRFEEFWLFIESNQLDSKGRLLLPPHPLLRYQLIQSATYLGIISKKSAFT